MKFRRVSLIHVPLFCLFAFPAFKNIHAEKYNALELMAHLKAKTDNTKQEYKNLQSEKQLQYLWDTDKHKVNNLSLNFFGKLNVYSTEEVKSQTETLFSFKDPNLRERLRKFVSVFTSKNFLRMLFGDNTVNKLIACDAEDGVFVWWDKEPSENPSEELLFLLRVKHTYREDPTHLAPFEMFIGGRSLTALDMSLVFAYSIRNDTVRFIGLKDTLIIKCSQHVKE